MEDEMGGACRVYGEKKKSAHRILVEKPEENRHLKNLDLVGRIIVRLSL
jgi:thiamine biosynthesis lipoprotein ApbE